MQSSAGTLQPSKSLLSHSAGGPWLKRWNLPSQLQQPPQLRSQFVSLTSSEHDPSWCAARQCSPTQDTGSAALAEAAATAGTLLSNDGRPRQPPLRPLARLHSASSKLQRQQRSFRRRRRHDAKVCAAAAVLQPPVAGETLTQLAARFMVSTLLPSYSAGRWPRGSLAAWVTAMPSSWHGTYKHGYPGVDMQQHPRGR